MDSRRAACYALLAQLPESGLDEALVALMYLVAFWQAREAAPPPTPHPIRLGTARIIRMEAAPVLWLAGE